MKKGMNIWLVLDFTQRVKKIKKNKKNTPATGDNIYIYTKITHPQKLLPRPRILPKHAQHATRHRRTSRFLNAPHHHTHVRALDRHRHALRLQDFLDGDRDLLCETFLDLETA
jgi:hypothetical protein